MTTTGARSGPGRRLLPALGVVAALWLGLTAPSVSPVAGPGPVVVQPAAPAAVVPAPAPRGRR